MTKLVYIFGSLFFLTLLSACGSNHNAETPNGTVIIVPPPIQVEPVNPSEPIAEPIEPVVSVPPQVIDEIVNAEPETEVTPIEPEDDSQNETPVVVIPPQNDTHHDETDHDDDSKWDKKCFKDKKRKACVKVKKHDKKRKKH